jgi:hypothetical protein
MLALESCIKMHCKLIVESCVRINKGTLLFKGLILWQEFLANSPFSPISNKEMVHAGWL